MNDLSGGLACAISGILFVAMLAVVHLIWFRKVLSVADIDPSITGNELLRLVSFIEARKRRSTKLKILLACALLGALLWPFAWSYVKSAFNIGSEYSWNVTRAVKEW